MKKITFLFIILNIFIINVYADEVTPCEYSDEYIEWVKLPNDEKAETIMPAVCKIEEDENIINNITSASFENLKDESFPAKYPKNGASNITDLVRNQTTSVKDQYLTGTCWTFASMAIVESYILKQQNRALDYSELHLEYMATRTFSDGINPYGFTRNLNSGGNYLMSAAYFVNHLGPIGEDKFMTLTPTTTLTPKSLSSMPSEPASVDVNEMSLLLNKGTCADVKDKLKKEIMQYSAVAASMNYANSNFNSSTNAYYDSTATSSNHAVTLVGWDDNYPRTNFKSTNALPSSNGAWIVKNSYGTSYGDKGFFYVSYEDVRICNFTSGILDLDSNFEDNYYNHATLGYNRAYKVTSSGTDTVYEAVTYTRKKSFEKLTEVTVGSYYGAKVTLYLQDNTSSPNINNAIEIASGNISYGGYKTFKLSDPKLITSSKFTIIAKIVSSTIHPLSASSKLSGTAYANMTVSSNQSYYSLDGVTFKDMANLAEPGIIPISVGTKDVATALEVSNRQSSYKLQYTPSNRITLDVVSAGIANNTSLNYKVYNSSNTDVTSKFTFTNGVTTNNHTSISFINKSYTPTGTYTLKISYDSLETSITFQIIDYNYVTSISTSNLTLYEGDNMNPPVTVYPSNATDKTLSYSSSNSNIASYANGKILAKSPGTATITVRALDGSNVSNTFTVYVNERFFTSSFPYLIEGNLITNIPAGTSYTSIMNDVYPNTTSSIVMYNSGGSKITSGNIGTNYKIVKTYATGSTRTYYFSVLGDVNGDGKISALDYAQIKNHIMGTRVIKGNAKVLAADYNNDGKISALDYAKIKNKIMGG